MRVDDFEAALRFNDITKPLYRENKCLQSMHDNGRSEWYKSQTKKEVARYRDRE